jgi:hypothetical protein
MIIDTFMFYNELDTLELRLTVLDPYVDQFVLVESEVTHGNHPKELHFQKNRERFTPWISKIKHIIVTAEESPKDENPWSREKFQRECILKGLVDIPDDAIVMVSDVDEIPNMKNVPFPLPRDIISIHMWMFEYFLDYLFTGEPWFGTVMTRCDTFKRLGPNTLRDNRWKYPMLEYSGWHLSSFGGPERIALKVNTFAHCKDKHELPWTPETFEILVSKGLHTDGVTKLVPRPPQVPLPFIPDHLHTSFFLKHQ